MTVGSLDPAAILEYATQNLRIEKILIQVGLDPNNITYDAIFNRLLDLALVNITFANVLALIGGIFLISTFVVRTIVPMRVLCIVSIVFFLGSAALAGSVPKFLMYFLALPVNVVRLCSDPQPGETGAKLGAGHVVAGLASPIHEAAPPPERRRAVPQGRRSDGNASDGVRKVPGDGNRCRDSARPHPRRAWISFAEQSSDAVGRMHRRRRGADDHLRRAA